MNAITEHALDTALAMANHSPVADVKYKLQGTGWDESDLYQAVAFATGYKSDRAAIVSFSSGSPKNQTL